MTDPIEAVAERLWEVAESQCVPYEPSRVPWSKAQDRDRQEVREQACAAIAAFLDAVREPSEAIESAALDLRYDPSHDEVWQAMIDALRAELLAPPGDEG